MQDTSLAFTIGVLDVIGRAQALGAVTMHIFEGYVDAAIIFIFCSIVLELLFKWIEKKTNYDLVASRRRVSLFNRKRKSKVDQVHSSQKASQTIVTKKTLSEEVL